MVEAYRTASTPTRVSDATADVLQETASQYYWCQNQTVEYCWPDTPKQPDDLKTAKRDVRNALYGRLKDETDLHANLVQAAITQTVENIDALQTDWEKGRRISKPDYDPTEGGWSMLFDKGSATFHKWKLDMSLNHGERRAGTTTTARFDTHTDDDSRGACPLVVAAGNPSARERFEHARAPTSARRGPKRVRVFCLRVRRVPPRCRSR